MQLNKAHSHITYEVINGQPFCSCGSQINESQLLSRVFTDLLKKEAKGLVNKLARERNYD